MNRSHQHRQALQDLAELLKTELGRTPGCRVGDDAWQHKARKLLGCLRRLRQLDYRSRIQRRLEEAGQGPVA